jgi:hypothetical protein
MRYWNIRTVLYCKIMIYGIKYLKSLVPRCLIDKEGLVLARHAKIFLLAKIFRPKTLCLLGSPCSNLGRLHSAISDFRSKYTISGQSASMRNSWKSFRPSVWEANSRSDNQKTARHLWKLNVHLITVFTAANLRSQTLTALIQSTPPQFI